MRLLAYDLSLDLIRGLQSSIALIRRRDARLAKQLNDAANGVAQCIAEATGRTGGDRLHLFRIALGSLRECGACLDIAEANGWLAAVPVAAERDRLGGMLYRLQQR